MQEDKCWVCKCIGLSTYFSLTLKLHEVNREEENSSATCFSYLYIALYQAMCYIETKRVK